MRNIERERERVTERSARSAAHICGRGAGGIYIYGREAGGIYIYGRGVGGTYMEKGRGVSHIYGRRAECAG